MKSKPLKALASLVIVILLLFCSKSSVIKASATEEIARPNYEYQYILIEEDGFLSVYETNNLQMPIFIEFFDVSTLPQADQDELEKGILILNKEELRKTIENFIG